MPQGLGPGPGHMSLRATGHLRPVCQNQGPLVRRRPVHSTKRSMFLPDVDGEKDQSFWGKENLTSEEQKAFELHYRGHN